MPQDKVKEVYGLISDLGYFKDENEFKNYVSDPKKRKEAFDLISDTGYFKDENEFNSYFTDVVKPTPPTTGPQPETPQPRNKVAEMLNQPKAVDRLKQVVPTSEVASGTKKPKEILTEDVKAFKESEANQIAYQKVTKKAVDQNIGVKELFKRESDGLSQFLTDDNKVEFDYYKQIDDASKRVNELTARTEATGNPITQADLQKAKFDKFKAQQQLLKYEKGIAAKLDEQIANLEKVISTEEYQDPNLIIQLKKDVEKLKLQRENPNYLRNPDEQIKQIYSQVGGEIETFRVPGATPREKIQNYALILKQQLDDLENQIREIDPNAPLDKPTYTSGYNLARQNPQLDVLRERRMNLIPKLQVVAPIALINKMPAKDNDWFGSSFTKAVKAELLPDKFTKQNLQDMSDNEVSEFIYNNNVITNLAENDLTQTAISKSKELGAPVKAFSGNWWGNLAGTSASMIPAFALGSGAVQGVSTLAKIPSVLNMTKRLYRVSNIAKNMQLGKYVVPTLKSAGKGIEYMAAEPFLNQEDLKDEASFLSGFLGQAVAGPMGRALSGKNVGNLVSFLFKENAPDAAKLITTLGNRVSSGLGEYGEEVGNTIGPLLDTYIKTGDFQNLKKDLSENFGTLDANLELFVGSVVMGMAMGGGSGIGKASMENSKKIYNQLPPAQQKKADDIANALKNDVEKAEVQAKKEEIQEGAEPLAEDILTEEDKQKKQEAIEKLNNPASTVAEKVEAGTVLHNIQIKEHNANITEKALEESEATKVTPELAIEEGIKEGEVNDDGTPVIPSSLAKRFDFDKYFADTEEDLGTSLTPAEKQKEIDRIEKALEEVAGEEVVSEEAVVETPSEEVAVEETKEQAPIVETPIEQPQATEEIVETPSSEVTPKEEAKATPLVDKTKSVTQTITLGLKTQGDKEMESDLPYNDVRVLTDVKHKGKDGAVKESTRISGVDTNSSFYKTVKGKSGKNYIVVGVPSSDAVGRPAAATVTFEFNGEVTPEIENKLLSLDTKSYRDAQKMVFGPSLDKLQNDVADILNAKEVVGKEAISPKEVKTEKLITEDKTRDILDEVTDEKIGEKKYQSFSVDFEDGARAFGSIEDGVARITDIQAPKKEGSSIEPKRGTKVYERVISKLKESGVKTIKVSLQSQDSRVTLSKLVEKGVLINPRGITGSSFNEHPTIFDINEQSTPSKEQAKEPVSEEVKQETPKKEVVKEQPKKAPAKKKVPQAKKSKPFVSKSGNQEVVLVNGELQVFDSKTKQEVSPKTRKKVLDEYVETVDFSEGKKAEEPSKEMLEKYPEDVIEGYVVDKSSNPLEVVEVFLRQEKVQNKPTTALDVGDKADMIAEFGIPRIKRQGFERFGDKNLITMGMAKAYFGTAADKGLPIDTVAKSMSDYLDVEITPEDLVKFMVAYPNGVRDALKLKDNNVASAARDKFKELTGLELTDKLASKVYIQGTEQQNKKLEELTNKEYESRQKLKEEYWEWYAKTNDGTKDGDSAMVGTDVTGTKGKGVEEKGTEVEKPKTSDAKKARIGEQLKVAEENAKSLKAKLDKAQASLNKDREAMQQNMFQANQISLLNDVDAKAKKVSNIKRDYDAAKEEVKSLKEQFDSLLEGQTEMDMDGNPALANVEATAKALEGKVKFHGGNTILSNKNLKEGVMYVSSDKGFSDAYSTEKMGQSSPKTTVVIPIIKNPAPLDVINKVAKKLNYDIDSFSQAELIEQKGVKEELAKLGYDGAIGLNDFGFRTDFEEVPVDVVFNAKKQILVGESQEISEAYHKAKADGSNPELVKAVEDLLSEQPTKKTKPSKKEIQELSSIGVTNFNLPNLVEEVKQMSKTEFVAAKGSEFESKEQAESYWEDTRNGIFNKEVSDLKNTIDIEVRKSRNDLGSFKVGSGKMWTAMGKLMGLYVKKGVTSFGDFIQATGYKATSAMKGLWDSIRGRKSTIKLSTKNANIRNINARLFYTEALDGIPNTDDAQVILDALKDTIDVYKTMSIHAAKNDVQDINNATDALTDLYVELSSDLENVKKRIAEELELGQKVFEAEKKLSVSEKLAEFFADDFRWQEKMQKEIEKTKGTLPDDMNPYIQKDIAIGRMADTVNRVYQKIFGKTFGEMATNKKGTEGMVQRMAKDKLNITDLDFFMMVQHAKERNARVKAMMQMEKDAEVQKLQDELTALQNANQLGLPGVTSNTALITKKQKELAAAQAKEVPDAGSGMTDAEADNFMKEFEKAGKKDKLEAYAKEFRETVIQKSIDLREEAGDLSPEEAEALRTGKDETTGVDFEFYIPLKVKQEALPDKVTPSGKRGARFEPIQKIKGTNKYDYTKRISPVTQSLLDFQASVKLSEDNKVAQSLYNLVKENPNKGVWEIVDVAGLPGGDFALPSEIKDNSVKVKIGGKVKYIKFNHQGLRDAWLKNNADKSSTMRSILRIFNMYNSFKRAILTQYNPEFAFTNVLRDVQDVIFNAAGVNIEGLTTAVIKNYKKATKASFKATMGNLDPNSEMGKVVDEYLSSGGKISWMNYGEIESEQKKINGMIAKYGDKGGAYYTKQVFKSAIGTLGALNESVEMATRLSVFKALRDFGVPVDKAASISKNLSVNFNKKGTATPLINTFYLFSNAGFQSLYAGMKALKSPRGQKRAAALFGLGMAYPFVQQAIIDMVSGDDDEKDFYNNLISEEEQSNSYIIPIGDYRSVKIPKPYGMLKVFFNAGHELGALSMDGDVGEHTGNMVSTLVSSFDPITGNMSNKYSALSPTSLRPFVEVNFLNRDYNKAPILPDSYGVEESDYLRYFERTNQIYKDVAKNVYWNAGLDVSPETLEYIVNDATGGVITTMFKGIELGQVALKGTEVNPNRIPFYSKFVVDMKAQEFRYTKDFWEVYNDSKKKDIGVIKLDNAIKYAKEGNAIRKSKGEPEIVKDLDKKIREIKKNQAEVKLQKEQREDYKKPKERK